MLGMHSFPILIMRNKTSLFFCVFLLTLFPMKGRGASAPHGESRQTAVLLAQLDSAITHIHEYDAAHEKNIKALKEQLRRLKGGLEEEMALVDQLIEAYSKFNYDSTILYINRNLIIY